MAHPTPDLLALVALGEDVEPSVLEHVAGCRFCFAEIGSLQQVVAVGRSLGPQDRLVAPHPRVWQRIADDIDDGRVIPLPGAKTLREPAPVVPPAEPEPVPLGGVDAPAAAGRTPLRSRRWFTPVLAAAVALVVGLGGGFALNRALNPAPSVVSATQLNALPKWHGANGSASVEKDPSGQRTLVVSMELPPTVSVDGTFEVWMSDSRAVDMVPMGTMSGTSARFPIPASVDLATHPIVDVSLEPRDDTDPAHSDVSVLRGRLNL